MKKVDKCSSAGTTDESSTNVHNQQVSQPNANEMLCAAISFEEGNKLIAKFMNEYDLYNWGRDPFNELLRANYHTSWNSLMPVVQKIESIRNKEGDYLFSIDTGRDYCLIYHNDFIQRTISVKSFSGSKIKSIWLAILEFIKWYNGKVDAAGSR